MAIGHFGAGADDGLGHGRLHEASSITILLEVLLRTQKRVLRPKALVLKGIL